MPLITRKPKTGTKKGQNKFGKKGSKPGPITGGHPHRSKGK